MLFITDCAQGARNFPLCLAVARSPVNVIPRASGNMLTLLVLGSHGMFQMAQCCPNWLSSPSVVSMKVIASDLVPAGTPAQSSSGLTPPPRAPPLQVYLPSNLAPSTRDGLVSVYVPEPP